MRRVLVLVCLLCAFACASAADLTVAVAANFAAPMQQIAPLFERDTGHRLRLAFGSTAKLVTQIRHGAPFHVLLAADQASVAALVADGLADPASRFTYATGRLALWSAQAGLVDPEGKVLPGAAPQRLALADPKLAPYGSAALQTLEALGLLPQLKPKLVFGDSVGQAFQFVATGNAPLGFVALSQIMRDGRVTQGSFWLVPSHLHAPLHQDAVALKPARGEPAAAALLGYLKGPAARVVMRNFGYAP